MGSDVGAHGAMLILGGAKGWELYTCSKMGQGGALKAAGNVDFGLYLRFGMMFAVIASDENSFFHHYSEGLEFSKIYAR